MNLLQALRSRNAEQRHTVSTIDDFFIFGGHQYPLGAPNMTMGNSRQEDVPNSFVGYAGAMQSNSIIWGLMLARMQVFSQIRFVNRRRSSGELFGDRNLRLLERPWPGGTTGDLLGRTLMNADLAGNDYTTVVNGRVKKMRPDWTSILLGSDADPDDPAGMLDAEVVAYIYKPGGKRSNKPPQILLPDEVAHFAPYPDPQAEFRGMSWVTPVLRELQADNAATDHKLKFFENAATPNLAVSLDAKVTPEDFDKIVERMRSEHSGAWNAYKTLYLAGGATVTPVGADMKQLDFKVTQGAGETRIALAAGVHPTVAGLSEGLQGASLNAGNYQSAKRAFSDKTLQHLWRNVAASFEPLAPPPGSGVELWFDTSDVPFLQDDMKDTAEIQQKKAGAIRSLTEAGYLPASVIAAIDNDDLGQLEHTGVFSVQLQPPGSQGNEDPETNSVTVIDMGEFRRLVASGWTVVIPDEE